MEPVTFFEAISLFTALVVFLSFMWNGQMKERKEAKKDRARVFDSIFDKLTSQEDTKKKPKDKKALDKTIPKSQGI